MCIRDRADPDYMMEHDYAYMVRAVVNMLSSTGTDTDILDKGLKFPGMDEMCIRDSSHIYHQPVAAHTVCDRICEHQD